MNILRFEMNVPTEVALQSQQGVLVPGRYGDRMMFPLADGRVMYVPPIVATQIEAQGILAGEPFQLWKASTKVGQRRLIEWKVKRIAEKPPGEAEVSGDAEPQVALPAGVFRAADLPSPPNGSHQQPAQIATAAPSPAASVNGNHPGHPEQNGDGGRAPATKLEHALKTAIAAAFQAEKYGAELGYVVRFDSDAIKSMAITVLINMSEGGRR